MSEPSIDTSDVDHLYDHVRLYLAAIAGRARLATPGTDEQALAAALQTFSEVQERIVVRELSRPTLIAPTTMARLGLSETEMHVVWLLGCIALNKDARALLPHATGETTIDPTLAAIKLIIHGLHPSRRAFAELAPESTLRRLEIVERSDGGGAEVHESRQTWAIARRMLGLLHGDSSLDPALSALACIPVDSRPVETLAVAGDAISTTRQAMKSGRAIVLATSLPGLGRRTLLRAVANEGDIMTLEIDARRLAKDASLLDRQLRAIARECRLLQRTPLIANIDALVDDKENRLDRVGTELVAQLDGLVLATCGVQRPAIHWDRPTIVIEMGPPTSAQRGTLWLRELGQGSASDAELLAGQYPLAPALIHHAAEAAKARTAGQPLKPEDIYAGIRSVLDDRLGQFAKRVTVSQTWEDLVLPQEQVDAIIELIARVRGRRRVYEQWGFAAKVGKGLGVSALFSGPPGTGKTMVAALVARDLGLELYQVDLAKVVSKWIGESEKNLAALFDAAEAGHAVLLFDEADALFGKRTEVRSSNDRHANLETNYLLQRLESFTGICVLTSNHESNIDAAFLRRLSLHLRFDVPDVEQREHLWRAMLPKAAPVAADLDLGALARRFAMSGGYIRNAAVRAAFLAADEDSIITGAHLERAARLEYEGMGKIAA